MWQRYGQDHGVVRGEHRGPGDRPSSWSDETPERRVTLVGHEGTLMGHSSATSPETA